MAYIQAERAMTAVREAMLGLVGSLRMIDAGDYRDAMADGVMEQELARRSTVGPQPFRVEMRSLAKSPATPSIRGNLVLYNLAVDVVVSRVIGPLQQANDAVRAKVWSDALLDGDIIRQAMTTSPNLRQTAAGHATDLAGDALIYEETSIAPRTFGSAAQAVRVEATHRFRGVIKSRPEV